MDNVERWIQLEEALVAKYGWEKGVKKLVFLHRNKVDGKDIQTLRPNEIRFLMYEGRKLLQ